MRLLPTSASFVASVLAAGVAVVAQAAPADFVGVSACGSCHPAAEKAWLASAHARASSADVLGRRAKDAACLTCHATGEGGASARFLPGVQCEACHGGGVAYAAAAALMRDRPLAHALGLRELGKDPAAMCVRCHRLGAGTRAAAFDYAASWKRISH